MLVLGCVIDARRLFCSKEARLGLLLFELNRDRILQILKFSIAV
jgi:hypothetical protein